MPVLCVFRWEVSSQGPWWSRKNANRIAQCSIEIESMVDPRTVTAVVRIAVPSDETLLCRIEDLKVKT